jgi:hypothetical protein
VSRDKAGQENNTRNAGIRRVMAGLFILKRHPPDEYDVDAPLKDNRHFAKYSDCLSGLGTPSGKPMLWTTKSAADTAAQAWAFHYYVSAYLNLHALKHFTCACFVVFCIVVVVCVHVCVVASVLVLHWQRHACVSN